MTEELMADRNLVQKTNFFSKEKRIAAIKGHLTQRIDTFK